MSVGTSKDYTKQIRVRNSGPVDAMLRWRVVPEGEAADGEDRVVDVGLATTRDPERPVRVTLDWHEQVEYDPPFAVEPRECRVAAQSDAAFVVSLPRQTGAPSSRHLADAGSDGRVAAVLIADAEWVSRPKTPGANADLEGDDDGGRKELQDSLAGLSLGTLSKIGRASTILKKANDPRVANALSVVLRTTLVHPRLQLEKVATEGGHTLRFKTWSTTVIDSRLRRNAVPSFFALNENKDRDAVALEASVDASSRPSTAGAGPSASGGIPSSLHKRAMLKNVADIPLSCTLDITAPFSVLSASSTSFSHKGRDCLNTELLLLSRRSLNLDILFSPPALPPASPLEPAKLKYEYDGELIVRFSTGQEQRVGLQGVVVRPALVASPPAHDFRTVRTDDAADLTMFLSNPTEVDIDWQLRHVPRADRVSDGIDGDNAPDDSVDDPSVFDFSEITAHMVGPSLPLKSAAACIPKDFNRAEDSLFEQTVTALTWRPDKKSSGPGATEAVTSLDAALKNEARANARMPFPITVTFKPTKNLKYCSRFRFDVHKGEGFDIVLQGVGSYEEDVLHRTIRVAGVA